LRLPSFGFALPSFGFAFAEFRFRVCSFLQLLPTLGACAFFAVWLLVAFGLAKIVASTFVV